MKELVQKLVNKVTENIIGKAIGFIVGFVLGYLQSQWAAVIQIKNMIHTRMQFEYKCDNHVSWLDFEMDGKQFHVYKNVYMNELNVYFACVLAGCFTHLKRNININVDDNFFKLSNEAQTFMIHHEAAHILNGDFAYSKIKIFQKEYTKALKEGLSQDEATMVLAARKIEDEYNADTKAMQETSRETALTAMAELYRLTYIEEVRNRYEKLGGNPADLKRVNIWHEISMCGNHVSLDDID